MTLKLKPEFQKTHSHEGIPYLFVRIPRTASSSICNALGRPFEHKTAEEWVDSLGRGEYQSRYTFTIVRDPYERFLSMFYFFGFFLRNEQANGDPNAWLANNDLAEIKGTGARDFLFRKQSDFTHINGKLAVDFVGKYEDLENAWQEIRANIGEDAPATLPFMRRCRYEKDPLTPESKQKILDYYQDDFNLFGYGGN